MPRPVDDVVPVAAVILSYNSRATLAEVLDRVAAQTVQPTRTVVVDNGSGDGTDQMLAATDVEALFLDENRGVGAGHNAGWREVMGSPDVHFVWALEHDAFPAPDCLERLLATFAGADPSVPVGAAIPAQVVRDGDRPRGPSGPTPTRMLHFNGTLLAVDALAAVGLCSEELFCGQEDRELALRIVGGGWSTQLDPRAVVVHATFRNAQGTRSTVFRRYYGWRNDLWLRVHVRKEAWARLRAVGAAGAFAARVVVRERPPWPQAQARVVATFDALTGRLGRREYRFLTDPSIAEQIVAPVRRPGGSRGSR